MIVGYYLLGVAFAFVFRSWDLPLHELAAFCIFWPWFAVRGLYRGFRSLNERSD